MRIKRVEIIGFKSFCDRAVVNIDASITAVVGPNGCGKSNIVDAIRWCMGEQSAKHLRGKAMEDVIFAGSESRGPSPMAEVSLTFDDVGFSAETLELALKSDEVAAERVLEAFDEPGALAAASSDEGIAPQADAPDTSDTPDGSGAVIGDAPVVDAALTAASDDVREFLEGEPDRLDFTGFTEVTITRRLFRDGTSHYFINKTPCRLRDVTDFFLGTGVGTKAYSIIEQGRIGQIVSARAADRRLIIEEAAGITKFKSKKKAAERKLEQTRQNLLRVSDIVAELDKRMGTLRRQAQKAERYRKYKTELRDVELWKASHRYLELHAEEALAAGRLTVASEERADARAAYDIKDAHVVAERADLAVEERRLATLQEQVYELDNRIRLAESKIGFETREAVELDARGETARAEIADLERQRNEATAEQAARQADLATLATEVEAEQHELAGREANVREARAAVEANQQALDRARAALTELRAERATAQAQLEALTRRREETERRRGRLSEDLETQAERGRELERELRRAESQLADARQTRLDLGGQAEGFTARAELLADEVARDEATVETLRTEAHRRRSRLQSLTEIQERYEGFARGTRAIMQRTDELALVGAVHGLVADVVRAPETLEIAVEAALGDRLGGILVERPEVGMAGVGMLKAAGAGRSAFVPVSARATTQASWGDRPVHAASDALAQAATAAGVAYEDRSAIHQALVHTGGEGVLGRMTDLVEFADGYEGVGRALLADCIVVDRLERAIALRAQGITETLITLEGDVVDARGVVAGGSRDAQGAGVLGQKREIRDLEEIVLGLDRDLTEATARLVSGKAELKQVTRAIEGLRAQVHQGDLAVMGHEKDGSRLRAEFERVRDRLTQLSQEQLELDERLATIGADEQRWSERLSAGAERAETLEREQLEFVHAVTAGRDALDALVVQLSEVRVRAAQLGEKRAAAEAAALRLGQTAQALATRAARLSHEIDDAGQRAGQLRNACEALAAEVDELRTRRLADAEALAEGRTGYELRVTDLTTVELAARELRQRAERLGAEVGQLELKLSNVTMNREVLVAGIEERYQLHVATVLADYHLRGLCSPAEDARQAELRDLLERMGTDINLTAIDEFAEVSARFEFLSAQRTDLDNAVEQLQRAIDKINKTSRRLFKETFTSVNNTFKQVFPRLFRGGQAYLSLTGGEDADLLEAGVEIMAQPPGKKNSTVDQLSGGEKALTAVAMIFSIFLIKPSPFCILDEVDAPLDEANVDRYNEIVREMTDRSQFIVITHNKRTMESADNLYGVTMKEPGVSMLVSVNLKKLGQNAA